MDNSGDIIAVGLNPAWQKTLLFPDLRFYEVNRSESVTHIASGKGINFVRALGVLGKNARVFQFAGGETGRHICRYLDEEGIKHISVFVDSPTRVCTTCLCRKTGKMTELIEPSGIISREASEKFFEEISSALPQSAGVAICGTFPPGISPDFYLSISRKAHEHNLPVLLDAWKDVKPVLENGIEILKINFEEIITLSGQKNIMDAIKFCFESYPVEVIAVTAGSDNAYLSAKGDFWEFTLPRLDNVVNPIGAGDTVSAIFFSEYLSGKELPDAFSSGLAAASASCLTAKAAVFDTDKARDLKGKIKTNIKTLC